CEHRLVHGVADVIGAGQCNRGAGDRRLAGLLDAVVVQVHVDAAGEAGGPQFAEVVVRHIAVAQRDRDGVRTDAARQHDTVPRLLAGEIAGRLGLHDRVVARAQAVTRDVRVVDRDLPLGPRIDLRDNIRTAAGVGRGARAGAERYHAG